MDFVTYLFWGIIVLLIVFRFITRSKRTMQDMVVSDALFDVNSLDDEVAKEVSFSPMVHGGSNFLTHKLKIKTQYYCRFKPTTLLYLFFASFVVLGIVLPAIFLPQFIGSQEPAGMEEMSYSVSGNFMYIPIIISGGLFFIAVGSFLLYKFGNPRTFDILNGCYYKGWIFSRAEKVPIKDIYAIQVLKEYCNHRNNLNRTSRESNPFFSYEINLVLKNKERVNVIDHGNREQIKKDAGKIAGFLNVPLWDALG